MKRILLVTLLIALSGTIASVVAAPPSGGDFVITKSTIDGGGGVSAGGTFVLTGTIGQPDAQAATMTGGTFKMAGGFWARVGEALEVIFKDGFETPL